VHAIEQHPAIRMTPAKHQQAIVRAGGGAMDSAVLLYSTTADTIRARHELVGLVGSMREQQKQFELLFWAGIGAVLLGVC
jgi:hypothetical protein